MASLENPEAGLERRYEVKKLDDPDNRHGSCEYFVLDLTHDPAARRAAQVYALISSEEGRVALGKELMAKCEQLTQEARHEEELRRLRREKDIDFFNE